MTFVYEHSQLTRRVLESLVPVICPPEAMELGLGADIVDHVGLTMSSVPPLFRRGLVLGLATYDVAALAWLPGRGRRAHQLSPDLAARYYDRWEHGLTPVGHELAKAVAQLLKLGCYEHPTMQERLGYTPTEWIEKVKRRRLTVYADDVRKAEAAILAPDPLRPPVKKAPPASAVEPGSVQSGRGVRAETARSTDEAPDEAPVDRPAAQERA